MNRVDASDNVRSEGVPLALRVRDLALRKTKEALDSLRLKGILIP